MKTAISIPEAVFYAAEEAAKQMSLSRSELFTRAIEEFLRARSAAEITANLNEVYANNPSELDPMLYEMTLRSLGKDSW